MWAQKYQPACFKDLAGKDSVLKLLGSYDWKKPLLVYGSTGVGKTVLIEVLANELDMDLVRIDNSNIKNGVTIAESSSIFGNKKMILVDHVDKIKDIKEIGNILERSMNPVVLITSDFSSRRLGSIKRKCQKLQIRKPRAETIAKILQEICQAEKISTAREILLEISSGANGDISAAINDLEAIGRGKEKIQPKDLEVLSSRDVSIDIFKALNQILIKRDFMGAIKAGRDLQEQPRDIILWIDENLPRVYREKEELEKAYGYLSRADIFLGRILRRQYWGFLRYSNALMTAGVNISKGPKISFTPYQFPRYFAKLGHTKKERSLKKSIGEKLSPRLHASGRIIAEEYIPLFRILLKKNRISEEELAINYRLNPEEIDYITS